MFIISFYFIHPSIHPSINFLQSTDLPLPSHFLQLLREETKAFLGLLRNIISPATASWCILTRCPNYLSLLLSMWRSSGSTLSLLDELFILSLRESPATLQTKLISAACIHNLLLVCPFLQVVSLQESKVIWLIQAEPSWTSWTKAQTPGAHQPLVKGLAPRWDPVWERDIKLYCSLSIRIWPILQDEFAWRDSAGVIDLDIIVPGTIRACKPLHHDEVLIQFLIIISLLCFLKLQQTSLKFILQERLQT